MCIGCRTSALRDTLIRLVRGPQGEIGVDRYLRAPGRGAHLCYCRACIEAAVKRKAIGRAFPGIPGGTQTPEVGVLVAQVVAAIDARIIDALTLGHMRRAVIAGADALEAAWQGATLRLLVLATDVGENTEQRWTQRAQAVGLPLQRYETAEMLGRTQATEARVLVGVVDAELAERLVAEFERRHRVLVAT